ncbi:MAG: phosphoribosylamine--glycine ligase [Magnetococcales bacterium]|nr:phosphoribosylamine--glycine ligase [Magnetococcales bacterium]MBF0322865.1 phosphoribosylamine--glycine ligase [Magnetococcales bacterium]
MRILVVGSGGREHALCWKMSQSPRVTQIFCAPGNAGMDQVATCVAISPEDVHGLQSFALREKIDLTVVGPEAPLVLGMVDQFQAVGLAVFGPTRAAAAIEGSKAFMKGLFARHGIPTASYRLLTDPAVALEYVRQRSAPMVVKASGLAAGKGAIVCPTTADAVAAVQRIMVTREFGSAGDQVVVEDFLAGEEASFMALVDGENVLPLAGAQDHKAVFDGDTGPNTGGMGAYSPAPVLTPRLHAMAMEQVMLPTVRAMAAEGRPYRGVLYAGLMIDGDSLRVLEFNARFGDPETQPLLMRMQSDLVPLLEAAASGSLRGMQIDWDPRTALCVVMTAGGYPGSYQKGLPISGLEQAAQRPDTMVFHAGTRHQDGRIVTHGGRVLGVTALGVDAAAAQRQAYAAVADITWQDLHFRRDIGYRAIERS